MDFLTSMIELCPGENIVVFFKQPLRRTFRNAFLYNSLVPHAKPGPAAKRALQYPPVLKEKKAPREDPAALAALEIHLYIHQRLSSPIVCGRFRHGAGRNGGTFL